MAWVAANHPQSRFAIINDEAWQNDSTGEWFPTLAAAHSVTTVQGREWNGQFPQWDEMSQALRGSDSCAEMHSQLRRFGRFDHLFVETRENCFNSPAYQRTFRNGTVTIYKVREESGAGSQG